MPDVSFCLVTTFYPPDSFGGDAVFVHRLANGLARQGHRVRVLHSPAAFRLLGGSVKPAAGHPNHPGVEVVPAVSSSREVATTYLTGGPVGYRRRLAALMEGFDVVHHHNPSLMGGVGALALGSGLTLYTTWEHWLVCPTHVLFRYGREVCTERTCWRCTLSYRRPPQLWRSTGLMRRSLRNLDLMLCPSHFTAGIHRDLLGDLPIEVLAPAGPEASLLDDLPPPPQVPKPYFLYAGRLEPIKGVDRLVRAFRRVRGAHLVVCGDGSQDEELHRLAAGSPDVHFTGRLGYPEVLSLCRDARAMVVPSAGLETFGGSAVEGMALGTPAVVRRLGPLPELVDDGGGMAFDDDDALVECLQKLTDDAGLADTLGRRAREVFLERFTERAFYDRYLALISEAAARTGRQALASAAAGAIGRPLG